MRKIINKGQQEMVGFILIVVMVVIAIMIFVVISVRKPAEIIESKDVSNMIGSMLRYTTDCAIVFEPQYDDVRDLIKSCYSNEYCSNIDEEACDHLEDILNETITDVLKTDNRISFYEIDVMHRDDVGSVSIIPTISGGICEGSAAGSQESIATTAGNLIFRVRVCLSE